MLLDLAILPIVIQENIKVAPCPKPELGDCWLWTGRIRKGSSGAGGGYAQASWEKRHVYVHRLIFETFYPIPKGKQLDHLCRVRHCVNPGHLEPVTRKENILRGESVPAKNALKTTCPKGHSLENCLIRHRDTGTQRECRTCVRDRSRRYKDLNREKINKRVRNKYHTNPEYRSEQIKKAVAHTREYRKRKRECRTKTI